MSGSKTLPYLNHAMAAKPTLNGHASSYRGDRPNNRCWRVRYTTGNQLNGHDANLAVTG